MKTFIDAIKAGEVKDLSEIDNWVEDWHNGKGEGVSLESYLGFSSVSSYHIWVGYPESLPVLVGLELQLVYEPSKAGTILGAMASVAGAYHQLDKAGLR